jgi:hypothetical protein
MLKLPTHSGFHDLFLNLLVIKGGNLSKLIPAYKHISYKNLTLNKA